MALDEQGPAQDAPRQAKARQIVADVMVRRAAGEPWPDEQVIAAHSELMPELGTELAKAARIASARRAAEAAPDDDPPGEDVGHIDIPGYTLTGEIRRGGQAVVYHARQTSTGRRVAVKVMIEGRFASVREKARFDREAKLLASVDHPHIVSIIDRGTMADGTDYFVMPLIIGRPLDEYIRACRKQHSSDRGRASELLRLFMTICDAVNAAHLRGIIHRDLKPSNIIIDEHDQPHILDFGLARTAISEVTNESNPQHVTVSGQFLGSLPWVSPEQAQGVSDHIDIRTDVYSLGVILYQLLTGGAFPYEVVGTMHDVLHNILTAEPTPPSKALAPSEAKRASAKRRFLSKHPHAINPVIEAVVLKALAKRREDRYQSAGELAQDIGNYLSDRPITARLASSRAWSVRGVALFALACICMGVVVYLAMSEPADAPRPAAPPPLVPIEPPPGSVIGGLTSVESWVANPAPIDGLAAWTIDTRFAHDRMRDAHHSPDGRLIAMVGDDRRLRLYDARDGRPADVLFGAPDFVQCLAWSPESRYLAVGGVQGAITLFDIPERKFVRVLEMPDANAPIWSLAWAGDGQMLIATQRAGAIAWRCDLRSMTTLEPLALGERPGGGSWSIALSPDSRQLLAVAEGADMQLWDAKAAEKLADLSLDAPSWGLARWSSDGAMVAIATSGGIELWDATSRQCTRIVTHPAFSGGAAEAYITPLTLMCMAWSPNAPTLAAGALGRVLLIDANTGAVEREMFNHRVQVGAVSWSADGRELVSSDQLYSSLMCRDVRTGRVVWSVAPDRPMYSTHYAPAFSDDGRMAFFCGLSVQVWDVDTAILQGTLFGQSNTVRTLAWAGSVLAVVHENESAQMWDVDDMRLLVSLPLGAGARAAAGSPDGRTLAMAASNGRILLWRRDMDDTPQLLYQGEGNGRTLAFSPDGRYLAAATGAALVVIDVESGRVMRSITDRRASYGVMLEWLGDNRTIAAVFDHDWGVQFWDAITGERVREMLPLVHQGKWIARSSLDDRLAIATAGGVHIFDPRQNRTVADITAMMSHTLDWSPDGRLIAADSWNGIHVYDVQHGRMLRVHTSVGDHWPVLIARDGHLLADRRAMAHLAYIAQTPDGRQTMLEPDVFTSMYQWRNDPRALADPARFLDAAAVHHFMAGVLPFEPTPMRRDEQGQWGQIVQPLTNAFDQPVTLNVAWRQVGGEGWSFDPPQTQLRLAGGERATVRFDLRFTGADDAMTLHPPVARVELMGADGSVMAAWDRRAVVAPAKPILEAAR